MFDRLTRRRTGRAGRASSWDRSGRNHDYWPFAKGESRVLADIQGPGRITHIWMTQPFHYRQVLLKITWDNAKNPSVLVPLGDFFGLGHTIVNSYECFLFAASTFHNNEMERGCALNSYVQMPFRERCVIELVNESGEEHPQYFYIDYETYDHDLPDDELYFHAEFRRQNPFGGWAHEITVNWPEANVINEGKTAWKNNYVILDTKGAGHYIGCNLSVTNLQGTWWGEGDDMIWVDGYKWPPDLHGTGSEDYFNHAWGMQPNAFGRHGTSIHEKDTGGYQTSYVHHLENPVAFSKEIKVTIEHGHANHVCNEMSSVAYWYAVEPTRIIAPPPAAKRMPVKKDAKGFWAPDPKNQITTQHAAMTPEMREAKRLWKKHRIDHVEALNKRRAQEDKKKPRTR